MNETVKANGRRTAITQAPKPHLPQTTTEQQALAHVSDVLPQLMQHSTGQVNWTDVIKAGGSGHGTRSFRISTKIKEN